MVYATTRRFASLTPKMCFENLISKKYFEFREFSVLGLLLNTLLRTMSETRLSPAHCAILRAALDNYGQLNVQKTSSRSAKIKFEANDRSNDHFHFDVELRNYTDPYQTRLEALATGLREQSHFYGTLGHAV